MNAQVETPVFANLLYEKRGPVAYVTLNRPKVLNALNTPTWADLRAAFEDVRYDASIRGAILTGAGDRAFIAGADIGELAHLAPFDAERSSRFGQAVLDLIEGLGKPVIAAINGFALGGGCETAMACTIRIAAQHARFGQPEVKLGLVPGGGGTQRLPRLVGPAKAKDLVFSGRMVKAAEAHAIGLADLVVPDDGVYEAALGLVRRYATGPALALRAAKQAIDHGLDVDLATGLQIERVQFAALFSTEDQRAGMKSFLENGPGKATFTGH